NSGKGVMNWRATEQCDWLQVSPDSGRTEESEHTFVTVDPRGLPTGKYDCVVEISDSNALNSPQSLPVTMIVRERGLSTWPTGLYFRAVPGDVSLRDRVVQLDNRTDEPLNWQVEYDCDWLTVSPSSGSIEPNDDGSVRFGVETAGMDRGEYQCTVYILDQDGRVGPETVSVSLTMAGSVVDAGPDLTFTADKGAPRIQSKTLRVQNIGTDTLNWSIAHDCNWMTVSPTAGVSSGDVNRVTVTVDPENLERGYHGCSVTISDANALNSPVSVLVRLYVRGPAISAPERLVFVADAPGSQLHPRTLTIENSGLGTLDWQIHHECGWITVHPASGSASSESSHVTVTADSAGLDGGVHRCTLQVSDPNAMNSPQQVQILFAIGERCMPRWHRDFGEWVDADMPNCWCYPRQCHGDADGLMSGSAKTGYYYVGPADLNVVIAGWLVKEPSHGTGIGSIPNGICADFAHDKGGSAKTGYYRVSPSDLRILIANWLVREPPHGPGIPADCLDVP
ncbi:MAG: BACON domain-containing protein, partial [Phycisphaerales bacterium]